MNNILYIVIPCYNEQEVLEKTTQITAKKLSMLEKNGKINHMSKIVFINDGSCDGTWDIISKLHRQNKKLVGINLTRNTGHQNALLAGMLYAKDKADVIITMDADLQDDINAIDEMLEKYQEGYEVVYGVRKDRSSDSFFKRTTANMFYKFMKLLGTDTVSNHADFRLLSNRVIESLEQYGEVNLFLRGIIPQIGYKTDIVYYDRNARLAGETKYPTSKMLTFAWEGITSFSVKPMRVISFLGLITFIISLSMMIYILVRYFTNHTVAGWSSIVISIWFIGGLVLMSMGIIGEYIGKIYLETKKDRGIL